MKKYFIAVLALCLALSGCTDNYTEETKEIIQWSEWDYSCMPERRLDFVPTEQDCETMEAMADIVFEDWQEFHNWEMPEPFIENYFSGPDFWDCWNIVSWSMKQVAFSDTIGDQDYWLEWWDTYKDIYWPKE